MIDPPPTEPTIGLVSPDRHGPILEALGLITTGWGFFESVVESLLAGLLGTAPQLLFPITADIAIGTRLKHLGMLGKLRLSQNDSKILNRLIEQASSLVGYRNFLIHGLWISCAGTDDVVEISETRPGKSAHIREFVQYRNYDYLKWLVEAITRAAFLFDQFGKRFDFTHSHQDSSN
jgi:hypothetical protein